MADILTPFCESSLSNTDIHEKFLYSYTFYLTLSELMVNIVLPIIFFHLILISMWNSQKVFTVSFFFYFIFCIILHCIKSF